MTQLIGRGARLFAVLAAICVGLVMMATVLDVSRRNLLGRALPGTVEYSELLMVSLVFLGLALAQRENEHVAVNLVTSRLPQRAARAVRSVGLIIAIAFLSWMAVETWGEAYRSYLRNEIRFGVQAVRVWPARFVIPIGLVALILQLALDTIEVLRGRADASGGAIHPVLPPHDASTDDGPGVSQEGGL